MACINRSNYIIVFETTIQKFGESKIKHFVLFFFHQGHNTLAKGDSKYIYNVTKDFYIKYILSFCAFYLSNNPEK